VNRGGPPFKRSDEKGNSTEASDERKTLQTLDAGAGGTFLELSRKRDKKREERAHFTIQQLNDEKRSQ
jgi:hypothetical protein